MSSIFNNDNPLPPISSLEFTIPYFDLGELSLTLSLLENQIQWNQNPLLPEENQLKDAPTEPSR